MNKLIKGAIAGTAGVVLLLGGGGTLALWNSSTVVAAGPVSSGTLAVSASGLPSWMDVSSDKTAASIPAIAAFKMVPGDTVELTQDLTVTATGNNLKATLAYDDATLLATGAAATALKAALVIEVNATGGANVTRIGTSNTFTVTPAAAASTVTVTVRITLPASVSDATIQNATVDLSGLAFKLQQVRP